MLALQKENFCSTSRFNLYELSFDGFLRITLRPRSPQHTWGPWSEIVMLKVGEGLSQTWYLHYASFEEKNCQKTKIATKANLQQNKTYVNSATKTHWNLRMFDMPKPYKYNISSLSIFSIISLSISI